MRSALELIYPLRASYMIDSYYMQIADRLGLDVDTIRASAGKVFREVQQREETARRREKQRERAQSSPDTQQAAGAPAPAPSGYDEVPYEEVPYDYEPVEDPDQGAPVPTEADAGPDAGNGLLTDLERRQLACEHELLTLLTTYPDSFRAYAERITEVEWVDARSETIAWSILATPEGTAPADAMAAARAVCPEAAAAGRFRSALRYEQAPDGDQHRVPPRYARAIHDAPPHEDGPGASAFEPVHVVR